MQIPYLSFWSIYHTGICWDTCVSRGIEGSYNTGEKDQSSALTEKDLLSFAWMIADGVDYLTSMKVRNLVSKSITYLFSCCRPQSSLMFH